MVRNARRWFETITTALAEWLDADQASCLPAEFKIDLDLSEDWVSKWGQGVVGVTEDYNQLSSIAHLESLPVTRLQDEHLCTVSFGDDGRQTLKKIRASERDKMVTETIPRNKQDYQDLIANIKRAALAAGDAILGREFA